AMLLVPQVVEQRRANVRPVAPRMQRRQEPRERRLERVVLAGVLLERFPGQLPGHPLRVEGVRQQVPPVDRRIDLLYEIHGGASLPIGPPELGTEAPIRATGGPRAGVSGMIGG